MISSWDIKKSTAKERAGNKNKVTENSNMKNNDKCKFRYQVQNIDSSCIIYAQVQNINLNLNSIPNKQKKEKRN